MFRRMHSLETQHSRGTDNGQVDKVQGRANLSHAALQLYKPPEDNCVPSTDKQPNGTPPQDHS